MVAVEQGETLLGREQADLRWLDPRLLDVDEAQPRQEHDITADEELAAGVREQGVLVPLIVVSQPGGRYQVLAGARRRSAALAAELASVPCLVLAERPSARAWLDLQLVENLHRRELSPLELAQSVWRRWLLLNIEALEGEQGEDGAATDAALVGARSPVAQIAALEERLVSLAGVDTARDYFAGGQVRVPKRIALEQLGLGNRSEAWARKLLQLLQLDPAVQAALEGTDASASVLRELAQREPEEQAALVEAAKGKAGSGGAGGGNGKGAKGKGAGVGSALREGLGGGKGKGAADRGGGDPEEDEDREGGDPRRGDLPEAPAQGRSSFQPDPQLAFLTGPSGHASKLVTSQVAPERGSAPPTRAVGTWEDDQVIQVESALEAIATICDDAGVLRLSDRQVKRLQPRWETAVAALERAGLAIQGEE
jgi:hypothetical protein